MQANFYATLGQQYVVPGTYEASRVRAGHAVVLKNRTSPTQLSAAASALAAGVTIPFKFPLPACPAAQAYLSMTEVGVRSTAQFAGGPALAARPLLRNRARTTLPGPVPRERGSRIGHVQL